ncbi:MAG: hypothetical protein Q8L15_07570 [Methylobacter sp.]|nr:hypothetical protein [Methylobacter sp.]
MSNTSLLKRLVTLEAKNLKVTPLCIIYDEEAGLTAEQQAQLDKADSEKQPVLLICISSAENLCHE